MHDLSRRRVTHGIAWSVPAVSAALAAPSAAASPAQNCTAASQKLIRDYFTSYAASLPDYSKVVIRVRHDQTLLALNGTVQLDYIGFQNVGSVAGEFDKYPFALAVDIVTVAGPKDESRSWNVDGATTDMRLADASGVSYPAGRFPGNSDFTLANGTQTFFTQLDERLAPTPYNTYTQDARNNQTTTISFQDGVTSRGRLNNKVVVRPLGFAPPTNEMVQAATGVPLSSVTDACYSVYYQSAAAWSSSGVGLRGMTFEQVAPNQSTTLNWYDADPAKTVKGTTLDSVVTGNFNSGSGQAVAMDGIF